MSIIRAKKEIESDANDIHILKCLKWTHPDLKTLTEAEIRNKLEHLYLPCLTTEGNPFLLTAQGREINYVLRRRTFDVPTDVANAVMKGFVGMIENPGEAPRFYITKRGNELITPKEKGKEKK